MSCCDSKENYGCVTKWLHAIVAVLILLQILGGILLDYMPGWVYTLHKSFGLVILTLMVIFVIWRLANSKPAWPADMKSWEKCLARLVHICLYGGFILMPLSGWAMATAAGKAPDFFWLIKIPMPFVAPNKALATAMLGLHTELAWILSALILLHILGALKHHFIDKNNVLKRMCTSSK